MFINPHKREYLTIFSSCKCLVALAFCLGVFLFPLVTHAAYFLNDQWFTANPKDVDRQWGLARAGFIDAWNKAAGSDVVTVAIIDTGVDATHEDLKAAHFVPGFNFITNTAIEPGSDSDDNGHGTLVAGIIAATPNNSTGISGALWHVSIMAIKALNDKGSGSSAILAEAIIWATDHGAQIINLSVGDVGGGHDPALANAIAYAFNKNVVIVAAAGNDSATSGRSLDTDPVFPICDDNGMNMVIGVSAVDSKDTKPGFANYGKNCVDVVAPGKRIISTINFDPYTGKKAPNAYAYATGTSMAVPFVTAQAALIKTLNPLATNRQIRDRILSTTDPIDSLSPTECQGSCTGLIGSGRINVFRSVESPISQSHISENEVVEAQENNKVYVIIGGRRERLIEFVHKQRFPGVIPRVVRMPDLAPFPEGSLAAPLDGTLIKSTDNPTVYYMWKGIKQPVTGAVFAMRRLSFGAVTTLLPDEINSWLTGSFLAPPDGSLIKQGKDKTLYWVVGGVLHPINYNFFIDRGLQKHPILSVSPSDFKSFPKGEALIR